MTTFATLLFTVAAFAAVTTICHSLRHYGARALAAFNLRRF